MSEDVEVKEKIAPYDTVFVADPNLAIDTQQVVDAGANGITRSRYRVRYENGEEANRVLEDTWTAQEPAQRRIAYGQRIEPQTATVDGQTITYWRKIKMYATSYHPAALGGDDVTATGDETNRGSIFTRASVALDRQAMGDGSGSSVRSRYRPGGIPRLADRGTAGVCARATTW